MYAKSGFGPVGGKAPGKDDIESETEEPGTLTPSPPLAVPEQASQ